MQPQDRDILRRARDWLTQDPDPHTRATLARSILAQDLVGLRAAFGGRLRFGTAGLRAIMGPGPRGMNNLVVRQSCAGLLQVLQREVQDGDRRGVAVGFDGRHNSRAFAQAAAGVFLAAGYVVHYFSTEVPTPVVGYWVKAKGLAAGVVITASHNPPTYNGMKVYWQDGAQIVAPQDAAIAAAIDDVAALPAPPSCLEGTAFDSCPRLLRVEKEAQQAYLDALQRALPAPLAANREAKVVLQVAYTPLHGVGSELATRAAAQAGYAPLHVVTSQAVADGDFPTLQFPNPEEPGSMDRVLQLAHAKNCDLACANDPDADRLAVAARDEGGLLQLLTGDELGILLADYLLRAPQPDQLVATTRASSRMLAKLAHARKVHYTQTLTGFKWLSRAGLAAAQAGQRMVFAYEEALGYAVTDLVWDKDGISALVALLHLADELQQKEQTLWHQLARLQVAHGVHVTSQQTVALDDGHGSALMQAMRRNLPQTLGPRVLLAHDDLLAPQQGTAGKSDMLLLYFDAAKQTAAEARRQGLRVIVRPSGTEPKLKLYYELVGAAPDVAVWRSTRTALQRELKEAMAELGHKVAQLS